ncbi:MAG: N-formylglutamate amidohydrolase [Paracoccaceae bacterium]
MPERHKLLDPSRDPPAVETVAATSRPDILLVCEHAGRAIPNALGDLGIAEQEMNRHIAYDIGAEWVARDLAARTGAALILQRYSRLVIDCNRPPLGIQSIPEISDGTPIPANKRLTDDEKNARVSEIFQPYADAVRDLVRQHRLTAAFSIHSFTPSFNGQHRPWHLGFCARAEPTLGNMASRLAKYDPALTIATNQPYQIDDETDWFIPFVAEPAGLRHALIEIRNDQIAYREGASLWATHLSLILTEAP